MAASARRWVLPPRVGLRLPAGDEPVGLQPGEQPAQVAGVEVERPAEVADRRHRPLAELVQHARLGQRLVCALQAGA
jgi:hypothetical protein